MTNIIHANFAKAEPEHEGLWPRTYDPYPTGWAAFGEPFTPPRKESDRLPWRECVLVWIAGSAAGWLVAWALGSLIGWIARAL